MADPPPKNSQSSQNPRNATNYQAAPKRAAALDLHSAANVGGDAPNDGRASKPFLGVLFRCCNQYARIYRRADLTAYSGKCPRCGKMLRVPIGSGGTGTRFFNAQ